MNRSHFPEPSSELKQWYGIIKQACWKSLRDVTHIYSNANHVGWRTVFNIPGIASVLLSVSIIAFSLVYLLHIL
ncbi:type II toxin-antitoxin system HigB family toxin [Nitrospira sp. Nam74]